ncbi:MAG TPA: hypothetical protein VIK70_08150 [Lysobacter sp.]
MGHAALLLQLPRTMLGPLAPLRVRLVVAVGPMALGADALLLLITAQALLLLAVVRTAHVIVALLVLHHLWARRDLPGLDLAARGALLHVATIGVRGLARLDGLSGSALLVAAMARQLLGLRPLNLLPGPNPLALRVIAAHGFGPRVLATRGVLAMLGILANGILARRRLVGSCRAWPATATLAVFPFPDFRLGLLLAGEIPGVVTRAGLGTETQCQDRAQRKRPQGPLGAGDVHCLCPFCMTVRLLTCVHLAASAMNQLLVLPAPFSFQAKMPLGNTAARANERRAPLDTLVSRHTHRNARQ